jgi:predicted GNAT family N-acyltransferase
MYNGLNLKRQKCEKINTNQNILDMGEECKRLQFGSPEQLESIELRRDVLRKPLGLDFQQRDLDAESSQFHMAYIKDGQVQGILILKPATEEGVIRMRQVAVRADLQGQGIGKKLVGFSEDWSIRNGYKRMELHARKTAVDFYKSMGYASEGDEFLEVGIPHMLMYKVLAGN